MSESAYECEAWEVETELVDHEHVDDDDDFDPLCPVFCIQIFANMASHQPTFTQQLLVPQQQLRQSWSAISSKLMQMNVPFDLHAMVMQKIIACGVAAVNESRKNMIPIVVSLCPVRLTSEFEALDVRVVWRRGASKGAIEALVKVEGFKGQCVICLEGINMKKPGWGMPCSHVYHQHCILRWLEASNLCPLCRFRMPTA